MEACGDRSSPKQESPTRGGAFANGDSGSGGATASAGGQLGQGGTSPTVDTAGSIGVEQGGETSAHPPDAISPSTTVLLPFPDARALQTDTEGNAYLLLSTAPWLVKASRDTSIEGISIRGNLNWASNLLVARDGTLYVGGVALFDGSTPELQIQHLSASGELIETAQMPGVRHFVGLSQGADGVIRAVVGSDAPSLVRLDGSAFVTESSPPVKPWSVPSDSSARGFVATSATNWAVAGAGDSAWLSINGAPPIFLGGLSTTSLGGLASDGADGWYIAWADGWRGTAGQGFYTELTRFTQGGEVLWRRAATFDPNPRDEGDYLYRTTTLVPLTDSVVFTQSYITDPERDAYATRYASDGTRLDSVKNIEPVMLAAPAGPNTAVLFSSHRLWWVTFPKATVKLRAEGDECTAGEFCESGRCCLSNGAAAGYCSSEACVFGSKCLTADDCADGVCLRSQQAPTTEGFCTSSCSRSADCPDDTFCVGSLCLSACSGADCTLPNTTCSSKDNAEDIAVWVCSLKPSDAPLPDPTKPCETNGDCASKICCRRDSTSDKICRKDASGCKTEIGGICFDDRDCISNQCANGGVGDGWCTDACQDHGDCGTNPITSHENACLPNLQGKLMCFPGCSQSDDTCSVYGADVMCVETTGAPGAHCAGSSF